MIARGFKPVAWVAGIGSAALCCYMLSLQVAAERAELAAIERQIVATHQEIRALQTELGTRGRLQQLEQWNAEVLALSAPVAAQFLESNLSLARFDVRQRDFADRQVRLASAEAEPATPQPVQTTQPEVRLASAESQPPAQPLLRRAGLQLPPVAVATAPGRPAASPVGRLEPARPAAPRGAVQARSLLDEGTLRELTAESRTERSGGTRN